MAALDSTAQLHREAEVRATDAVEQAAEFVTLLDEVLANCGRAPAPDAARHQNVVKALKQTLDAELADKQDQERLTRELAAVRGKQAEALRREQVRTDALEALLRRSSLADEQELIEAALRGAELANLNKELNMAERNLIRAGVSLEQLEHEIADEGDPDTLAVKVTALVSGVSETEKDYEAALERLTSATRPNSTG